MTRKIPNAEKVERVFNALSSGVKSLVQLIEETEMSRKQVRDGWRGVRRMFGTRAVVNHNGIHGATYELTDELMKSKVDELHQSRHILTRMRSEKYSLEQMASILTDITSIAQYYASIAGMTEAMAPIRAHIRMVGTELGFATTEIESWVADQSHNGADTVS